MEAPPTWGERGAFVAAHQEELNLTGLPEKVAEAMRDLRGRIDDLSKDLKDAREETKLAREENKQLLEEMKALIERRGVGGLNRTDGANAMATFLAAFSAAMAHRDDDVAAMARAVSEAVRSAQRRTGSAPPEGTRQACQGQSPQQPAAGEHHVTAEGAPHMLLKGLSTVMQVWEEFHKGSPGRSPLCKLIREQGMEWKDARYVSKQMFSERMTVVGAVVRLGLVQNITNGDAALWLQAWQDHNKWHVNRVRKELVLLKQRSEKEKRGWGALIYEAVSTSAVLAAVVTIRGGRTAKDITDERICAEWGP